MAATGTLVVGGARLQDGAAQSGLPSLHHMQYDKSTFANTEAFCRKFRAACVDYVRSSSLQLPSTLLTSALRRSAPSASTAATTSLTCVCCLCFADGHGRLTPVREPAVPLLASRRQVGPARPYAQSPSRPCPATRLTTCPCSQHPRLLWRHPQDEERQVGQQLEEDRLRASHAFSHAQRARLTRVAAGFADVSARRQVVCQDGQARRAPKVGRVLRGLQGVAPALRLVVRVASFHSTHASRH